MERQPTLSALAARKLRPQFPDSNEGRFMLSIIESAIKDAVKSNRYVKDNQHGITAKSYLRGEILHAEICGVSPDWIRMILKKLNINLTARV